MQDPVNHPLLNKSSLAPLVGMKGQVSSLEFMAPEMANDEKYGKPNIKYM